MVATFESTVGAYQAGWRSGPCRHVEERKGFFWKNPSSGVM